MNLRIGKRENVGLEVAIGAIPGAEAARVIAKNAAVTTSMADVWPQNIVRTLPAAKAKFGVSSANAADAAAETGAQTVKLYLLDENFEEKTEVISMNGQTKVETTGQYLRFQKAEVLTVGSGGVNAGIIYVYDTSDTVTAGVPQTATKIYGHMVAGENVTVQGMFTVPARKTYLLRKITFGQYDSAARYNRWQFGVKEYGGVWKTYPLIGLCTAATTAFELVFDTPLVLAEKTEFRVQAIASAAGSTISAILDIIAS